MKIAVIGTANSGKSTLLNDFVKEFPQYSTPTETYRDLIEKEGLKHSSNGNQKAQKLIMDFLVDQITKTKEENVIYDRCTIDALMYTMYIAEHNKNIDEEFVIYCINMVRQTLKFLDLIIYIPQDKNIPIVNDGTRDISQSCIDSVGNLFESFYQSYLNSYDESPWFPTLEEGGCPLILPVSGDPEARILQLKDYVDDEGSLIAPSEDGIGGILQSMVDESLSEEVDKFIIEQNELAGMEKSRDLEDFESDTPKIEI